MSSALRLRCRRVMGVLSLLPHPWVSLDGGPQQAVRWGDENVLHLAPGDHHIRVWYRWILGPACVGQAHVRVPPESSVHLTYTTRPLVFMAGSITIDGSGPPVAGGGPTVGPGWFPDPAGRHQQRWWDGTAWTPQVADAGLTTTDPV